jgi:RNA polymerase nonessential primary-like sigma factor
MMNSITLISNSVHGKNPLQEASLSPQTASNSSMMMICRRKQRLWHPRAAVVVTTAMVAAVLVAVSTSITTVVAAFHIAPLSFIPPAITSGGYSSSSLRAMMIATEQERAVLLNKPRTPRQQRQQRHERTTSLQNLNTLERLYSLPVIVEDRRRLEDESTLRFIENMEQQQQHQQRLQQQQQPMAGRMKLKKQSPSTIPVSTTTTATMPSLGKVKVVKGRKTDRERILRSMKTTPLAMKSRSSSVMTMKNKSDATAAVATTTVTAATTAAAPVIVSTLEDAASSATVQFRGLSTTSYRGNRKQSPIPPAAATAFKKSRPTLTSNTTMTMAEGTTTTSRRTRSSTMPGLGSIQSDKQRAFRDGIRVAEQQSGRKFVDTPELRQSRRRFNGENMYKNSASVPDSLAQFAHEIHQEGRITRQEEIALGTTVQEAIRLHRNWEALREQLCREPTDDEWCAAAGKINMQAIREAIDDGLEAKNKLVTSNLRMVQSVVNTYIRNGLSAQYNAGDLMQEGIMALIRAAEKFEPDRGWKFSTYAMYWVRASVKRNQVYQSRVVSVPQRLYESHKRLLRVGKELEVALGRKPTHQELGAAVDMSTEQVKRCFTAMEQRCYSLDQEIRNSKKPLAHDGNKNRLIDIVDCKSPDDDVQRMHFIREDIIETLHRQLSPEEVELLLFRYGLKDLPGGSKKLGSGNGQPTIAELSRAVGKKPDRVRRIINRALHQLRSGQSGEWLAFEHELMR